MTYEDDNPDFKEVALHESAHAVSLEVFGPGVKLLSTVPDPDTDTRGRCIPLQSPRKDLTEPSDREKAITDLTGPACSVEFYGQAPYLEIMDDALNNLKEGRSIVATRDIISACECFGSPSYSDLKRAWEDARRFVHVWEEPIRGVVDEIFSASPLNPVIPGDVIRYIVRDFAHRNADGSLIPPRK